MAIEQKQAVIASERCPEAETEVLLQMEVQAAQEALAP